MTAVGNPSAGRREWVGLAVIALPSHLLDAPLLDGARDAFTQGLHVAAIIRAALAAALAVIAATVLRRAQATPEAETDTDPSKSDQLRISPPAKVELCSG